MSRWWRRRGSRTRAARNSTRGWRWEVGKVVQTFFFENMIVGWKSCTNIYLENMMISEVGKGKTNGKVEMCRGWLASWTPWPRDVKKDQSWPISWYRRAQNRFSSLFQLWPSGVLRVWIRHQGELGPDQRDHYGGPAGCFGVSFSPDLKLKPSIAV